MTEKKKNIEKKKFPYKKIIIISTIILFILVLIALIYYLIIKNNARGQFNNFKEAVNSNHYSKLSEMLSNNEDNITKTEAKHFVEYVKKDSNNIRFKKEMETVEKNLKNDDKVDLGTITDVNDKPIITFKKNGKQFLFLDKIAIKPHLYTVYVKELDNTSVYKYEQNKLKQVAVSKNSTSKVGEFFVGNYSIDAQKTFKDSEVNGKTNGQLIINTDKKNKKGQVVADDVFSQVSFKTKLQDEKELDKDSFKLYINNNETDYNKNKVYGKYPYTENPISVYAVGKIDDKEFRTNTVKLKENPNQDIQNVKLEFDKAKVHRYKYDTDDKKDKSKDFMKKYMKHLNKAYSKGDYDYIKNDIDKGSDLAKRIKKETKHKQKIEYKIKSFDKIERNGNKLNIKLTKSNNDYTTQATYTLKFDYKDKFEITEYKD